MGKFYLNFRLVKQEDTETVVDMEDMEVMVEGMADMVPVTVSFQNCSQSLISKIMF